MLNGKQCTGQKQENIAIDDSGAAEMLCDKRTTACAEDEEENHAVIMQAFIAQLLIAALHETKQQLCTATEIARTHCGGVGQAMHLTKALHLHGADKGNQHI